MTAPPSSVCTTVGALRLDVPVGHAEAQVVPWPSEWWAPLLRGGLDRPVADRLISALAKRTVPTGTDGRRGIPRSALYQLSGGSDTAAMLFAVTAWGIGDTGDRRFAPGYVIKAIRDGRDSALLAARDAAANGIEAMWAAHFARPPQQYGQVSYGTKWLHVAGWGRTPTHDPAPVILDQFVHAALTRCAGWDGFAYPGRARTVTRDAWLRWCEAATTAAVDGLTAADVERAVFAHGMSCPAARWKDTPCPQSSR